MNYFNRITYLSFILVLIYSCRSSHEKQDNNVSTQAKQKFYNINIRNSLNVPGNCYLSSIATEIHYIPLETNPFCLLSKISDLKLFNDNIFISDKKALYKFDSKGNFIQQIGRKGNGPGEYGMVFFFSIIEKTNEIILFSYPAGKINIYDIETGTYKRSFRLDFDATGSIEFPSGKISFFTSDIPQTKNQQVNSEIFISNSDGQITDSIPNSRLPKTGNLSSQTIYYKMNRKICYMGSFQDTLIILSEKIEKQPYVDFCLNNTVKGNEIKLKLLIGKIQYPDFLSIHKVLESSRYFFIDIQKGVGLYVEDEILSFLYNKESKQLINCPFLINDIDSGMPFWPKFIDNDTLLVDVQYSYQIIDYFQSNKAKGDKSEKCLKLANSLNEKDNPVLIIVKLR